MINSVQPGSTPVRTSGRPTRVLARTALLLALALTSFGGTGAPRTAEGGSADVFVCPGASLAFPFASGELGWSYALPPEQHSDRYQLGHDYRHTGIDVWRSSGRGASEAGTPVYSPDSGVVGASANSKAFYLHGDTASLYLAHVVRLTSTGTRVQRGDLLGYTSDDGHVHISVGSNGFRDSVFASTEDPSGYFAANLGWPAAPGYGTPLAAVCRGATPAPVPPTDSSSPSRPTISWNAGLSATAPQSVPGGRRVTLTATSAPDVGPSPYYLRIVATSSGETLASCGTTTGCSVEVTITDGGSPAYVAVVSLRDGSGVQAQSLPVTVSAVTSNGAAVFGGVDLDQYCRVLGHRGVRLDGPTAFDWHCVTSTGGGVGIDVSAACRWQYPNASAISPTYTYTDPLSWRCVSPASADGTSSGTAPSHSPTTTSQPSGPATITPPIIAAPGVPVPLAPSGSTIGSGAPVILVWAGSSETTSYDLELWGGVYGTMSACSGTSATSCAVGTMWAGGPYFWRVRGWNSAGASAWSSTATFSVGAAGVVDNIPSTVTPPPYRPTHGGQTVSYLGNNFRSDDGTTWIFQGSDEERSRASGGTSSPTQGDPRTPVDCAALPWSGVYPGYAPSFAPGQTVSWQGNNFRSESRDGQKIWVFQGSDACRASNS